MLVRIRDEEGIEGVGEADPRPHITGETLESATYAIRNCLARAIQNVDVEQLEQIHFMMDRALELNPSAKSAVDMALYDLLGKRLGVPVYSLIGGRTKDELPINAWCGITDPKDAARVMEEKLSNGYNYAAKLKVGVSPSRDVELVKRIRRMLPPQMDLIIDANQAWDLQAASRIISKFHDDNIAVVEQPVNSKDLDSMIELTRRLPMEVMADESVWSCQDAYQIIKMKAASMINIKLIKAGGVLPARKIAALAESANLTCMTGSAVETSMSLACEAHFALATSNARYFDPTLPEENLVEDVAEGIDIKNGRIRLSEEPGRGVRLNEAALSKYEYTGA